MITIVVRVVRRARKFKDEFGKHHTVDIRSSVILRAQAKAITVTAEREAAMEALLEPSAESSPSSPSKRL